MVPHCPHFFNSGFLNQAVFSHCPTGGRNRVLVHGLRPSVRQKHHGGRTWWGKAACFTAIREQKREHTNARRPPYYLKNFLRDFKIPFTSVYTAHYSACVVRGNLVGVGYPLPQRGFQEPNSSQEVWSKCLHQLTHGSLLSPGSQPDGWCHPSLDPSHPETGDTEFLGVPFFAP